MQPMPPFALARTLPPPHLGDTSQASGTLSLKKRAELGGMVSWWSHLPAPLPASLLSGCLEGVCVNMSVCLSVLCLPPMILPAWLSKGCLLCPEGPTPVWPVITGCHRLCPGSDLPPAADPSSLPPAPGRGGCEPAIQASRVRPADPPTRHRKCLADAGPSEVRTCAWSPEALMVKPPQDQAKKQCNPAASQLTPDGRCCAGLGGFHESLGLWAPVLSLDRAPDRRPCSRHRAPPAQPSPASHLLSSALLPRPPLHRTTQECGRGCEPEGVGGVSQREGGGCRLGSGQGLRRRPGPRGHPTGESKLAALLSFLLFLLPPLSCISSLPQDPLLLSSSRSSVPHPFPCFPRRDPSSWPPESTWRASWRN